MKPKHAAAAAFGSVQIVPVTALAQVLLIAGLAATVSLSSTALSPAAWGVGIACGLITNAALSRGLSHYRTERLSLADWVTLARATLAVGVAALVADSFGRPAPVALLVSLAAVALALDAVDGWVARRTRTTATLGARFDGEVDAFLILVLSVYVARSVGAWVLAIGAARYVFFAAGWPLPWLRAPLPPRFWRKTVAAAQGVFLTVAASHLLSPAVDRGPSLVVALALLAESFGRDVWWLWRHRGGTLVAAVTMRRPRRDRARHVRRGPGGHLAPDAPDRPIRRRSRASTRIAVALTVLAVVIVWAALVAPDQPNDLTLTGFLRIPLEGLVLIALALVLPRTPRRILAGIAGLALALVVVLKALNYRVLHAVQPAVRPTGRHDSARERHRDAALAGRWHRDQADRASARWSAPSYWASC